MKKHLLPVIAAVAAIILPVTGHAQWLQTSPGTYDYNNTANWTSGLINGNFTFTFGSAGTIAPTFGANTTLASGWNFNSTGTAGADVLQLRSTGGTARTVTLGGDVSFISNLAGSDQILIGSTTAIDALNISLGANRVFHSTALLDNARGAVFVNPISGSGFGITKTGSGIIGFTADNTFSGALTVRQGTAELRGGGVFSAASAINLGGQALVLVTSDVIQSFATLTLDNASAMPGGSGALNLANRINNAAPINAQGGSLLRIRGGTVAINETLGAYTSSGGLNLIRVENRNNAAGNVGVALSFSDVTRTAGSSVVLSGSFFTAATPWRLGQVATGAADSANVLATTINGGTPSSALVNGILPGFYTGSPTSVLNGLNSLVTYGTDGFKAYGYDINGAVISADFVTDITTSTATQNLLLTGATANAVARVANSLTISNNLTGAGTLTLTSGALVSNGGAITINNNLNFNGREGQIGTKNRLFLTGNLTNDGGNGLTLTATRSDDLGFFFDPTSTLGITGPVNVASGGLVNRSNTAFTQNFNIGSAGVLDIWDNNRTIGALSGSGVVRSQRSTAGPAIRTLSVGNGNGSGDFSGSIIDGGNPTALTKIGSGTQTLSGANTYTGATIVTAGTLLVNGSLSATSTVTVNGGTFGGNGTVNALTVNASGTLAPGSAAAATGILNTGNLSHAGALAININGATVGSGYDQVNVIGSVNLIAFNTISLTLGYTPTIGSLFFLINNDGSDFITGLLNGHAQNDSFTLAAQEWQISYLGNFGSNSFTGGNDLVIQAVPEPSVGVLLIGGLCALMILRRRRRLQA